MADIGIDNSYNCYNNGYNSCTSDTFATSSDRIHSNTFFKFLIIFSDFEFVFNNKLIGF